MNTAKAVRLDDYGRRILYVWCQPQINRVVPATAGMRLDNHSTDAVRATAATSGQIATSAERHSRSSAAISSLPRITSP